MTRRPLVIVGAGPAGMAAAIAAAEAGVEPLLLDAYPRVGGQIYRQSPETLSLKNDTTASVSARRGDEFMRRFHSLSERITVRTNTRVWGLFPPRSLAVLGDRGSETIEADRLILATGAYEYVPPFPGWTLPGAMTPGAAQQMAKTMGVLPGKRAIVAGTGPFLLVVAEQLHRAGMQVAAVVEAAATHDTVLAFPRLLSHIGLLREGLGTIYRLRRAGVPILRGQIVVEARGAGEVREVVVAPCDRQWHPNRSRVRVFAVDTLCVGYGFVPRTQLPQLAGCRMRFAEALGGWIPEVDDELRTSVPGVWVAGDGGGVAGALAAEMEGCLAGLSAAHQLGVLSSEAFDRARQPIRRRLRKLRRFRAALDDLSRLRPGLNTLALPETIVCRCEELTRADIESGVDFGGTDLRTLKVMTRLGMGPCQGCMCWPAAARWIAARTSQSIEAIGPASVRPPILPLRLGDMLKDEG